MNKWISKRVCRRTLLIIFASLFFLNNDIYSQPEQNASPPIMTDIAAAVQRNYGGALEAVTVFTPFHVTGDFNGDGTQDLALVVQIKQPRAKLPKEVRLANPFEFEHTIKFPADPASENKLALAIIHGWKLPQPTASFLLLGESPVLLLESSRAISSEAADRKGLIETMSRRRKTRNGPTYPRAARGDVIVMGTEVGGDSLLYWNGRTYVWEDSAED